MNAPDTRWPEDRPSHTIEKLQLEQGDISKRLSRENLEVYWGRNSQESFDMPSWTKEDATLQTIVSASSATPAAHLGGLDNLNLSSTPGELESNVFVQPITTQSSPKTEPKHVIQATQSLNRHGGETEEGLKSISPPQPIRRGFQTGINGRVQQSLRTNNGIKSQQRRTSRSGYTCSRKNARIQKRASPHPMRTRLSNIVNFYELGPDGVARRYRSFR